MTKSKPKPVKPVPVLAWGYRGHWQTFQTKKEAVAARGHIVGWWNCIRVEIRPSPKRRKVAGVKS